MRNKLLLIFALILFVLGLFLSYYPFSKKVAVSPYEIESIVTTQSTFQTITFSTSETSYTTVIKDETHYAEEDFETKLWHKGVHARPGIPVLDADLQLQNLERGDKLSITIESIESGRLEFSINGILIQDEKIDPGVNKYDFSIDEAGQYLLHIRVIGPMVDASIEPFKAIVKIIRLRSEYITETWTTTSIYKRSSTLYSTSTLTEYSTAIIPIPLENGHLIAYALWGLTTVLILAFIIKKSLGAKYCIECGGKLGPEDIFCNKCGAKQR